MLREEIEGEQSKMTRSLASNNYPSRHSKESQELTMSSQVASTSRRPENPLSRVLDNAPFDSTAGLSGFSQDQSYASFNEPYPVVGSSSSSMSLQPSSSQPTPSIDDSEAIFPAWWPGHNPLVDGDVDYEYAYPHLSLSGTETPLSDSLGLASSTGYHFPAMKENIRPQGYVLPHLQEALLPINYYAPPPGPPPGWLDPENLSAGNYGALVIDSGGHHVPASDISVATKNPKRKRKDSSGSVTAKGKGKKKAKTCNKKTTTGQQTVSNEHHTTPQQTKPYQVMERSEKCLWTFNDGSICGYVFKTKKTQADGARHFDAVHFDALGTKCQWACCKSKKPSCDHYRRSHFTPGWCSCCKKHFSRSDAYTRHLEAGVCPNGERTWEEANKAQAQESDND
ncbi:hypothetical protein CPB85DRAFT_1454791 [Mucidula mucida]|nr:hypothetical protein CPB85DRAFT_1454791 [Mucidula mucida]